VLVSRLWLDSVLQLTVASAQSFDQGSPYSSSIKALHLALNLALHRTVGSVSVQSIEALRAVLIVQLVYRQFQGRCRILPALLLNGPIRIFRPRAWKIAIGSVTGGELS
jgi:hypothetical protein